MAIDEMVLQFWRREEHGLLFEHDGCSGKAIDSDVWVKDECIEKEID